MVRKNHSPKGQKVDKYFSFTVLQMIPISSCVYKQSSIIVFCRKYLIDTELKTGSSGWNYFFP